MRSCEEATGEVRVSHMRKGFVQWSGEKLCGDCYTDYSFRRCDSAAAVRKLNLQSMKFIVPENFEEDHSCNYILLYQLAYLKEKFVQS